jgi:hypothetical protein
MSLGIDGSDYILVVRQFSMAVGIRKPSWRQFLCGPGPWLVFGAVSLVASPGCASSNVHANGKAVVSVSAVNYSSLTDSEIFARVNAPTSVSPVIPTVPRPDKPVFYLILPGEIYPSDVPLPSLYHELEVSLEHRGYYSALAQVKAGLPLRIDFLLRVHYGVRPWLTPIVRIDRVTWGNDGLVAKRYKTMMHSDTNFDSRQGLSLDDVNQLSRLSMTLMSPRGSSGIANANSAEEARIFLKDPELAKTYGDGTQAASDFCFVVVEAFKFSDVKAMDTKAPCAWMIFIAVPADNGETLSGVLASMLKTAEPYYGGTTDGLQVHEVPAGKVELGEPVEMKPVAPEHNPAVNFGPGHPP